MGCVLPGDLSNAFGAGVHFVMIGGVLSGHDESGGELIMEDDNKQYKLFYSMSSNHDQDKYNGGM